MSQTKQQNGSVAASTMLLGGKSTISEEDFFVTSFSNIKT